MSKLNKLARLSKSILSGRPGRLGTKTRRAEGSAYIEKPPIEAGQGLRKSLRRKLEDMGLRSRLQRVSREDLQAPVPPQPPQVGAIPPPPPGPLPPDPVDQQGLIPPPFPSGKRGASDEWFNEWQKRKTQKDDQEEDFDDIEVLGRSLDYDEDDFQMAMQKAVIVQSSNVYSYFWQPESKYQGVLYVTFLAPAAGKGQPRQGPGPTYAYFGVTTQKYRKFRAEAASSPGSAVWDHLRVRGTIFGHQVQYRLIAITGEYVPRKATRKGFATRYLKPIGRPSKVNDRLSGNRLQRNEQLRQRGFQRSTLPPMKFGEAERGTPDRGAPDRG